MRLQDSSPKAITPRRKALYYGGTVCMMVGFVCFFAVLAHSATSFSQPFSLQGPGPGFFVWAIIGMALVIAGGLLRGIGARGLAGSGVVLDPQRAREDLAPYTQALGGMAHDVVEGFQATGGADKPAAERVVLRCRACQALNQETARFCNQCGKPL